MNNYESTKNKINKVWQQTTDNENNSNKLKSGIVKSIPLNYSKVINQYDVYKGIISNNDPIIYKVNLKNFPESFLPNLKMILISTSESAIIESYNLLNIFYIFYQGAATIEITLNIVNPRDAK